MSPGLAFIGGAFFCEINICRSVCLHVRIEDWRFFRHGKNRTRLQSRSIENFTRMRRPFCRILFTKRVALFLLFLSQVSVTMTELRF